MTNVTLTDAARDLVRRIQADHGEVVLVQNTGCVCGDAPQCLSKSMFLAGAADYSIDTEFAELTLWRTKKLDRNEPPLIIAIDARPGRRGGFALENSYDSMFVVTD